MVGSIMTELQKRYGTREILENTQLSPKLTLRLEDMNLLPKGIIGFDCDKTIHDGPSTLHRSCLDMEIFQHLKDLLTVPLMEDIKRGRYGNNGVEILDKNQWKSLGSLEAIANTISLKFLKQPLTPEEILEFDRHQTENQCSQEIQDQARMTRKTYECLKKLMRQYKVYILTNNVEEIFDLFLINTRIIEEDGKIPPVPQIGLPALKSIVRVTKNSAYYPTWEVDPDETAEEEITRGKRHEKPETHNMTMAIARTMRAYRDELEQALKNNLDLQNICTENNLLPTELIRYLLIRAAHLDRLFVGDSLNSDKGVADKFNSYINSTAEIKTPKTNFQLARYSDNDLPKALYSWIKNH